MWTPWKGMAFALRKGCKAESHADPLSSRIETIVKRLHLQELSGHLDNQNYSIRKAVLKLA